LQAVKDNSNCHVIYSKGDHSGIVEPVESLRIFGDKFTFTNIIPNNKGVLPIEEITKTLNSNTKLICFSYVHSELGAIQEVRKISQAVRDEWKKLGFDDNNLPKIFIDANASGKV
jgi:cysteine sulfinate desulfinase/cysteine desulfurase-like protein